MLDGDINEVKLLMNCCSRGTGKCLASWESRDLVIQIPVNFKDLRFLSPTKVTSSKER